jgi:hypothetical protein
LNLVIIFIKWIYFMGVRVVFYHFNALWFSLWEDIVLVRIVLKTRRRLVQYGFSIQYRLVQYLSILYIALYNNLLVLIIWILWLYSLNGSILWE